MKFGIVSIFPPVTDALNRLRLAERLDFDTFWVCDSHIIWNECYSLLGYLVASSQKPDMQFGTMVTNPVSRDPLVVASAFATLRDLAGEGRLLCGIGRGDSAVRVMRRQPAKIAEIEAAMRLIQDLTGGKTVTIDGNTSVVMPWVNGAAVPVYAAAYGARMLEAAGRSADGVIIECADPHYISWALGHVRRGREAAGRDLSGFAVVSCTATYVSGDLEEARSQVRPFGAVVGNHVAEVLRNTGANSLPPELEAFIKDRPEYDYYKHVHTDSAQAGYVPDEIIDRLCIVGSIGRCAERVGELRAAGVTHVNFYAQTEHYDEHMKLYADHILPAFRGSHEGG
ncbi:MAG TPA: TIGR03842 family LLM class F420-dependent oxidoreductase [Streptosporangiaceae bacterium]|nr:TIGR03842 family LLM class F420-dependent oxidoreductase [Streptosporangiaceae bacterium]